MISEIDRSRAQAQAHAHWATLSFTLIYSTETNGLSYTVFVFVSIAPLHIFSLFGVPFRWPSGLMGHRTLRLAQTKVVFSIKRTLVTPYTQTHTQPSIVINNSPVAGLLTV